MGDRRTNRSKQALKEALDRAEARKGEERRLLAWFARYRVRVRPGVGK